MSNTDTTRKILIVDDEELVRKTLAAIFEEFGFNVIEAANGHEGLQVFSLELPDIVFTDLKMPVMNGFAFIVRLKEISPDTPVIVISGAGDVRDAVEAIRLGAWDYVTKPIEMIECLDIVIQRVIERARLITENRLYQEHLEELVKQRTEELHDSEIRFRILFESANDAIILIHNDRIISCNRKMLELFRCSQNEILDHTMLSFSPLTQPSGVFSRDAHKKRMISALSGAPQFYEWRYFRRNGETFDVEISLNRLEFHGDLFLQAIMRDITDRKEVQQALLENARIKRELEIAQEIQQSFLPCHLPNLSGLLTACRCVPADNVGGDYYDFFYPDSNILDVVIADVAGHSIGSALLMTETRSVLHAKVSFENSPCKLLSSVNDLLYEDLSRAEILLSMSYARLDLNSYTLHYANAGHTRSQLFRSRDGSFEELDADGLLMGVRKEVYFEEKEIKVEIGDILILHTDGITESENMCGEFFGTGQLHEVIAEHRDSSPDEIIKDIFQKISDFTGSKAPADDMTMVIMKVISPP